MDNNLVGSLKKLHRPAKNIKKLAWLKFPNERFSNIYFKAKRISNNIPTIPKLARLPAISICTACFLLSFALTFKPAFNITVNGKHIGFADSMSSINLAKNLIQSSIEKSGQADFSLSDDIEITPSISLKDSIKTTDELVYSIANSSENICMASVITVNGEIAGACSSADDANFVLNSLLGQYKSNSSDNASFVQDVKVITIPVSSDLVSSSSMLLQHLKNEKSIDVQVISSAQHTESIPYQTQKIESDQIEQNIVKTMQFGKNGIASVSEQIVTLNGQETQRTVLHRSVITPATDCIVAVGTKSNGIGSGQFITPISGYRFSSAFKIRDGRWHKGVDLAAPVGTPIYAADSGVVTISKLSDSYGYYVVIDHQNGLKTLYAHNSSLLVKEGDIISKGQQIALSGNTGNSTGPHLHFEIHSNDVAVNPEIFLNFGTEVS